jgi:hypothetical protein
VAILDTDVEIKSEKIDDDRVDLPPSIPSIEGSDA